MTRSLLLQQASFFATIKPASKSYDSKESIVLPVPWQGVRCFYYPKKGKTLNNEKEYVDFLKELIKRIEERYGGKVKGEVCTSVKNNNVPATGLLLKKEGEQVAPNFYLEKQFVDWMSGNCTLDEIAVHLSQTYEEELKHSSQLPSLISFEWEEFRHNVYMRLINTERNKERLQEIPHQEFLDLSLVYSYSVPVFEEMAGTLVITNEHLKLLNITKEELHQAAKSNGERFQPIRLCEMKEMLLNIADKLGITVTEEDNQYHCLYVITNKTGMFGAVAMILEEELKVFSKRISNSFYILPSSIHELILVPASCELSVEYLASMVHDINETHVDPTEVLSDSIYFYDMETNCVEKVF